MDDNIIDYESNGYYYQVNESNQIIHAEGKLRLEEGERNPYAQKVAGGENRHTGDDGGHLIGTRFGGSGELDNLVAEDRYINRGAFKSLENEWADNLKEGNDVYVEVDPVYHGKSVRPDIIAAKTEIVNGDKVETDYFSVTNENLESEEFVIPEEEDNLIELWNDESEVDNNMAKTLTLTNDEFRQPTKEELMASGEEAIDRHMDILRDEMRSDGMEDGPEMEEIINGKREESMSELRSGVYGNDDNNNMANNTFEEATDYRTDDNDINNSSFVDAENIEEGGNAELTDDISENSVEGDFIESDNLTEEKDSFDMTDSIGNNTVSEDDIDLEGEKGIEMDSELDMEFSGGSENSFSESMDLEDSISGGMEDSFSNGIDDSISDGMGDSLTNSFSDSISDGMGDSLTDSIGDSMSEGMDFSRE